MVDATDLKSVDRKVVRVQVPSPPYYNALLSLPETFQYQRFQVFLDFMAVTL